MIFFPAVAALAAVASVAGAAPQAPAATSAPTSAPAPGASAGAGSGPCNNSPQLCERAYNKITYMGAHDSSFLRDKSTGNSPAGNQFKNATVALDAGIRLLQTQLHKVKSAQPPTAALRLCHSSCGILDAGPLEKWLAAVREWMVRNPNEVVTLILVNSDSVPAQEIAGAFDRSGMTDLTYKPAAPGATANWPTLGSMISQGGRFVSFVTNVEYTPQFPYLLPQFNYIFETAFEVTQLDGFNCTLNRPQGIGQAPQALAANYMGLVNHFKYQTLGSDFIKNLAKTVGINSQVMVPDVDRAGTVNSAGQAAAGNLGLHVQQCRGEWKQQPNFVLVDFWDVANPLEAADSLNGVNAAVGRKAVPAGMTAAATLSVAPPAASTALCLAAAVLLLRLL
ncbi:hypothetical protein CDD83_1916 [Cordyceps sp. RAO-2017]|nr:hypothetical protein CDD83_1916 [Cordyceps sp. RAO-2017]